MSQVLEICRAGVGAFRLHPLRNLVTTTALVAVLLPFLAGLGISRGILHEAEQSVRFGAELYVTGSQLGRTVPVPVSAIASLQQIEGVSEVAPRIVGDIELGKDRVHAVLVGVPLQRLPGSMACIEGRLYEAGNLNELVVGTELARRLQLKVGALLPPFYHSSKGDRISKVVGVFRSDVSLWQANLILTSFETASAIFDQQGLATDLLVYCRPGYHDSVKSAILRIRALGETEQNGNAIRPQVTTREDLQALLPTGMLHREGIFNLHFLLMFVVGILVVLVTSGSGLSEHRREIGILKATGWKTDEILLRSLVENSLISVLGTTLAILLAFLWLRAFNGYWLASLFLTGVEVRPSFPVPFHLGLIPLGLAVLISFAMVMVGSLYATWRAAIVAPREAMR